MDRAPKTPEATGSTPRGVRALWAGEVGLPQAFWWYGVALGFLINLIATIVALGLAVAEAPAWIIVALYLAPMPYNLLVVVGVWRSARHWRGDPRWADLARIFIALFAAAATLL